MPPLSTGEIKKAVELLLNMGIIRKNKKGFYEQTDQFISTGYDARSLAITNFLVSTIDLARGAIDRFPRDQRSMSALTFSISADGRGTVSSWASLSFCRLRACSWTCSW